MKDRIVIVDGNSLINRAYYAMQRPMITTDGMYTQGLYGFMNMIRKIRDEYEPAYMAVCWDMKSPTFRHKDYAAYKAGRKKMPPELAMQIPVMKELLTALRIPNLEKEGYEADDLIGTLARESEERGLFPLVITGDKDALQLVSDKTKVLITVKGLSSFDLYDPARLQDRYGLSPAQFIDLKGLMGDKSDNIPGIPGVGEKTGIRLLQTFGSMDVILTNTEAIQPPSLREKIKEGTLSARMSRKLAEIDTRVPLTLDFAAMKTSEPDRDTLIDLFVRLEFHSFLKRMDQEKTNERGGKRGTEVSPWIEKRIKINDEKDLAFLQDLPSGASVFLQVFSDDSHISRPAIYGIALSCEKEYFFVSGEQSEALVVLMNDKKWQYIGHGLKSSYYPLMTRGLVDPITEYDGEIAQYVLDPSASDYSLPVLLSAYLHESLPETADPFVRGEAVLSAVRRVRSEQEARIRDQGAADLLKECEFPLIGVLASMEQEGFTVEKETLLALGEDLERDLSSAIQAIYREAGRTFNINSPKQLSQVLFDDLALPPGKKTKTGYSTDADTLEKLATSHPIVQNILHFRSLSKLKNTYVDSLIPLIGDDGKIHAHFLQTGTATGRISCAEPNLQNIPVRTEQGRQLRKAFVPRDAEHILIGADYSQIELRLLAALSGDRNMIEAFKAGQDIHRSTAARVFGLPYEQVKKEDRGRAKAVNFGVIYGISGYGLARQLHISPYKAQRYIDEYFAKHEAVRAFMDTCIEKAKATGYTETLFGRRRYIPEIQSHNRTIQAEGERYAMNSPIQGTAADIIKIAMIRVSRELRKRGLKARLILQVHDELILDCPRKEWDQVEELLTEQMEHAVQLDVDLLADPETGETWYEL